MDITYYLPRAGYEPTAAGTPAELDLWFAVSGDMDDFIYYGEPEKTHSEK